MTTIDKEAVMKRMAEENVTIGVDTEFSTFDPRALKGG